MDNYILDEWIPEKNGFFKKCVRNGCAVTYIGRLNKNYCSDKCKTRVNNDKAIALRNETKDNNLKIQNAIKITQKILGENLGEKRLKNSTLYEMGFSFSLPTSKLKFKNSQWDWNRISPSYAFRIDNDSVILININKYGTNNL